MGKRLNLSRRQFLIMGGGAALTVGVTAAGPATEAHSRLNKNDRWYEYCRPYLEELNPRDNLDLPPYV